MSDTDTTTSQVKSMRQRRILDVAAEQPDATSEEIAAQVPSATADLVENVFDTYGDPAAEDANSAAESAGHDESAVSEDPDASDAHEESDTGGNSQQADQEEVPDSEALTPTQQETLRAIATDPTASQRELAEQLGVTAPSVCRRVNAIPGFEWGNREEFVDELFDNSDKTGTPNMSQQDGSTPNQERLETIENRLATVEQKLTSTVTDQPEQSLFTDPEFVHKLIRVCLESETISEDEERQLIAELL